MLKCSMVFYMQQRSRPWDCGRSEGSVGAGKHVRWRLKDHRDMCAMLCSGVRPLEDHRGLPKPLWIVVFCWPQCVDSFCTLGMTCFTGPSDASQRLWGMRLFDQPADPVENTIVSISYWCFLWELEEHSPTTCLIWSGYCAWLNVLALFLVFLSIKSSPHIYPHSSNTWSVHSLVFWLLINIFSQKACVCQH